MKEVDHNEIIAWLKRNIQIEETCITYYQQFPELGRQGRQVRIHQESLAILKARLVLWEAYN